jgi:hypothetical protein
MVGLATDAGDEPVAQVPGGEQEVAEGARPRPADEEVEQLGQIGAERVAAGEEPEIAVDAARPGVVVAGGEVAVAAEPVGLLTLDEARLAVGS